MAQRTGAERFIALVSKATSAGAILALVALASLAVSGCGGDSDAQTASAPSSPEASSTGSGAKTADSSGKGSSAKGEPSTSNDASGDASGAPASASPSPSGSGSSGEKHGPHIKVPKGPRESAPTPAERANATIADIALQSPAIEPGEPSLLPATYTCDGKDTWPQLRWAGVPAGTAELVLFAMNVQPVGGKLFFDWAVAGIDPSLEGIEEGRLPKGAVVGINSFGKSGYSICPLGAGETYVFALYALPASLSPRKGFEPHALRDQVLASSGNVGLLAAAYGR